MIDLGQIFFNSYGNFKLVIGYGKFYPLDAGYFLIFIDYFWYCLQTLLISWKQLYFLKACCSVFCLFVFLADMRPAVRPGLQSPSRKAYCLQDHTDVMGIMSNFHAGEWGYH